jgi:ribulose-phosphate 3-epimerase
VADLAPSIISADYTCLADSLRAVEPYSVAWHVDVMDGHYVPNLTIGPMAMDAIARISSLPQDVHVMISNVDETWEWYAKAGARRIAFHADVCSDPVGLAKAMNGAGVGAGLAVNPDVAVAEIERYLDAMDHAIVMSVFPGFSGQRFIPEVVAKITQLKDLRGDALTVYVDGGVSPATAQQCTEAGADVLISASAIFGASDPPGVAAELQRIGRGT